VRAFSALSGIRSQNATILTLGMRESAGMCLPFAIPPQPIIPIFTILSMFFVSFFCSVFEFCRQREGGLKYFLLFSDFIIDFLQK
jgi:hypothetical protein